MTTRRRILLPVASLLVLALVGAVAAASALGSKDVRMREELWVEVRHEPLVRRVEATGELRSTDTVAVGCPMISRMWNFTIAQLADEGLEVSEGMPLVAFDARELQERLEVRSSELDTARKELEKTILDQEEALASMKIELAEARANKKRLDQKLAVPPELRKRIALDKLRLDHALAVEEIRVGDKRLELLESTKDARIAAARDRVALLEREVAQIEKDIARMRVSAPRAGFVVHEADWNGNKPKVGESVWRGRTILRIANLETMEVAAEVPEPLVGHVELGQRAEVRLDAAPDRIFHGEVVDLGRLVRTKSWDTPSMVLDATIAIDDPDADLMRPGMAAEVVILAEGETPSVLIPEDAIRISDGKPIARVRTEEGDETTVPLRLGARWDGTVVVREGLAPGDRVRVDHEPS